MLYHHHRFLLLFVCNMSYRKVPDKWLEYCRFQRPIGKTRIISIKTPLKENFNNGLTSSEMTERGVENGVPKDQEFTPRQLMESLEALGYKLGLVIDLTYTTRYYDGHTLEAAGVAYQKIFCPGQQIPPEEVYIDFKQKLRSFLEKTVQTGELAAVHCTHGVNRAGYLVARYLIDHCHYDIESAIRAVGEARGHPIERQNYIDQLRIGPLGASASGEHSRVKSKEPWKRGQDWRSHRGSGQSPYRGQSSSKGRGISSRRSSSGGQSSSRGRSFSNERSFSSGASSSGQHSFSKWRSPSRGQDHHGKHYDDFHQESARGRYDRFHERPEEQYMYDGYSTDRRGYSQYTDTRSYHDASDYDDTRSDSSQYSDRYDTRSHGHYDAKSHRSQYNSDGHDMRLDYGSSCHFYDTRLYSKKR